MSNEDANTETKLEDIVGGATVPPITPLIATEPERVALAMPAFVEPKRKSGKLTRDGMLQVIREGGSVIYNGRILWRAQDLPDELEIAGDDEAARAVAVAKMKKQQAALTARIKAAEGK